MKKLSLIFSIMLGLTSPNFAQAQTSPEAEEVGTLFGTYMCKSLIATGKIDDDKVMEEFVVNLMSKYGEENTLKMMDKLEGVFSENDLENNPDGVNLMRGALNNIINDDTCFKVFLKDIF